MFIFRVPTLRNPWLDNHEFPIRETGSNEGTSLKIECAPASGFVDVSKYLVDG